MTTCWSPEMVKSYCAADYSLYKVYDICNGKHNCELFASSSVFSDPCPNTTKYLDVEFFCEEIGSICDGSSTTLICPDDGRLVIVDASYGRQGNTTCPDDRMIDLNCKARLSLDIVLHECENKKTCNLQASSQSFGDPCPDTSKYLSVSYRCTKS
ncbi:hypothetical protein FSP39_018446 [Pinctada imbricata]|uniref:SUEL-type lectin domain-containing protein n=1 Tax=Pinctada imbricata TaxID=66713 RepID=A0AA89BYZ0_PINIB|nr:hypothetical protein FSP39_018446 [Pinctada imbricata]